jgi:large subunit ribosomal protein L15
MNYRRLQDLAKQADAWAVVLDQAGVKPPAEAPKGITADPAAVSDPVMKAGRCRFSGAFPNADLPIFYIFKKRIAVINIRELSTFESGSLVDEAALVKAGLVKGKRDGVKLLGQGEIRIALNVKLNHVSTKAREKIEAAGGSVEVV